MSITPVFDQTVVASDADLWKSSPIFPLPPRFNALPDYSMDALSKADVYNAIRFNEPLPYSWGVDTTRLHAKVTGEFPKPEPKWRTFLRCLFWWLP